MLANIRTFLYRMAGLEELGHTLVRTLPKGGDVRLVHAHKNVTVGVPVEAPNPGNIAFRPLFNYIKTNNIAMTTPVFEETHNRAPFATRPDPSGRGR